MNSFDSLVNNNLGWIHENKYVLPVVSLVLGVYAALARPKLPKFIEKLFTNPVFRLLMISYIIYRGNKDPQLAIMIAAAFLITIHMINKKQVSIIAEKMSNQTAAQTAVATAAAKAAPKPAPAPAPAPKPAPAPTGVTSKAATTPPVAPVTKKP